MKIHPHLQAGKAIAQEPTAATASSARAAKSDTGFSAGQQLSGRVVALESDGRVVLDINGRTVTAYSAVRLQIGEKVEFVVSRGGDMPLLALKNEGPTQQLFRLLASDLIGSLAKKLDLLFSEDPAGTPEAPSSNLISPFAGQFSLLQVDGQAALDNLLFTLLAFAPPPKPTQLSSASISQEKELLQLLAHLEKFSPQPAADQGAIRQLVSLQQAFSAFNQQPGNNLLLIMPLFFTGKSGWGEWLVRQEQEQGANREGQNAALRFDFFLQLSNLGEMQLALLLRDKNLQGTFFLEDGAVVKHVAARLRELQDKLVLQGFEAPLFSCRVKQQNNQLRLKKILEEDRNIGSLALVDLTA